MYWLADRTHRLPVATAAVAQTGAIVVSHTAVARVERTRPVVAETARRVEIAVVAIARSRKKYEVTVYFTC